MSTTLIVEKSGKTVGPRAGGVEPGSVNQEHIVSAVTIVVEDRNAVPCRLEDVVLIRETSVVIADGQTCGSSDIVEIRPERGNTEGDSCRDCCACHNPAVFHRFVIT